MFGGAAAHQAPSPASTAPRVLAAYRAAHSSESVSAWRRIVGLGRAHSSSNGISRWRSTARTARSGWPANSS